MTTVNLYKAPHNLSQIDYRQPTIFLAGSIDMGRAEDWQEKVVAALTRGHHKVNVLNPRRDYWDPDWHQTIDNPQFREQVQWELAAMERADLIFVNLTAKSKAPISLMELGLHAAGAKMIVTCHGKFYRRGNVEIVCNRYRIPLRLDLSTGIASLTSWLRKNNGLHLTGRMF